MPYIPPEDRDAYDEAIQTLVEDFFHAGSDWKGHMNYVVSSIIAGIIEENGGPRYSLLNDIIGVLECIKMECYRRALSPYEDLKIEENGDVYSSDDSEESDD